MNGWHVYGNIDPFKIPEIADKLLNEYWNVAESLNIKTFLLYGTCLGFVRDGGYTEHDNDIDVGILGSLGQLTPKLIENGFIRAVNKKHTHFLKYNILLDIFSHFPRSHQRYFQSFDKVAYKGKDYDIPHPVEEYLKETYGDWRIIRHRKV